MGKWISVDDEMPEAGDNVLLALDIYCSEGRAGYWATTGHYSKGGDCWGNTSGSLLGEVPTHWMPLPDPPELSD
jgi:hypothetical protein